jgi:hypothetical protein
MTDELTGGDQATVERADGEPELSFEQTMPRSLAHRRALGEVFLTDSAQVADDEFVLGVQVPRAHSLWFDRLVRFHDPLAPAEAARQAIFVIVHRYLGAPIGPPFSMRRLHLQIVDLEAFREHDYTPLEGILRLRLAEARRAGDTLGRTTFEGEFAVDGRTAMTVGGDAVFLSQLDYGELREYQRARKPLDREAPPDVPPLDPGAVGRRDARNVVIGEPSSQPGDPEQRYPLRIDLSHPSFFDHSYDHVPGPVLAEAFRQAAVVTATRAGALATPVAALTGCEAAFADFAEPEALIECTAARPEPRADGSVSVEVACHQFGKQLGDGRIELRPYPDA